MEKGKKFNLGFVFAIVFIFVVGVLIGNLVGIFMYTHHSKGMVRTELKSGTIYAKFAIPDNLFLLGNQTGYPRYYLLEGINPSDLPEKFMVKEGESGSYLIVPYKVLQVGGKKLKEEGKKIE